MSEYIEKEKTKVIVCDSLELYTSEYDILCDAIDNIPPDDVSPVVHGKWIKDHEYKVTCVTSTNYHCSNCGRRSGYKQLKLYKYCPKCGAKMDLEE